MASSLVTAAETLTFARRKTSSSKLSLSGLLAPKRVSSCGLNLSMGAGRFGPKRILSANRPASELRLYQLIRQLGSSKRSIVEEEGGSLLFPIVGDGMHVSTGRMVVE